MAQSFRLFWWYSFTFTSGLVQTLHLWFHLNHIFSNVGFYKYAKCVTKWLVMLVGYECIPLKLSCTKKHCVQTLCALDPSRHTGCVSAPETERAKHTPQWTFIPASSWSAWVRHTGFCSAPHLSPMWSRWQGGFHRQKLGGPGSSWVSGNSPQSSESRVLTHTKPRTEKWGST